MTAHCPVILRVMRRKAAARETVSPRVRAPRRGLVRLEVQVPRQDAPLVRALAALLRDGRPEAAQRGRQELNALLRTASEVSRLKELLAAAPLEGVEFQRSRETGPILELP